MPALEDLIKQRKSEREMAVKDSVIHKQPPYNPDFKSIMEF